MTEYASQLPPPERRVFANRTLNLRALKAVGCDMDYTLIHYRHDLWEARAYDHVQRRMGELGFPVEGLKFDPEFAPRGLIVDLELGNLVKASRFGYVTRAAHGTRMLTHEEQRHSYSRVLVDLSEPRWVFLNTLFSLSEAGLYAQLVDRLDAGAMSQPIGYRDLYEAVRKNVNVAHMEGTLKAEIMRDPDRFVVQDPELPLTLLDLKHAGKTLMLITNSEWVYTRAMMSYAFDRHLPKGMTWRDLFDLIIVEARKPAFFTETYPALQIADEATGLMRSGQKLARGGVFFGGNARAVESHLGLSGEEILYIGDHLYADVHVTKDVLRWRTALVIRELEDEIVATQAFTLKQIELTRQMAKKTELEQRHSLLRLSLLRLEHEYAQPLATLTSLDASAIKSELAELRTALSELDQHVAELAKLSGELGNARWGLWLRAGSDKSRMARQLERYADVYTSRVSNFLHYTPFAYLRPPPGSLPHDPA